MSMVYTLYFDDETCVWQQTSPEALSEKEIRETAETLNGLGGRKVDLAIDSTGKRIKIEATPVYEVNDEQLAEQLNDVSEEALQISLAEDETEFLTQENQRLRKLLGEAQYIMSFHQSICPMNILHNFSGSNEHLSMYRDVTRQLEEFKCEIVWDAHHKESMARHKEWMARLKQGRK